MTMVKSDEGARLVAYATELVRAARSRVVALHTSVVEVAWSAGLDGADFDAFTDPELPALDEALDLLHSAVALLAVANGVGEAGRLARDAACDLEVELDRLCARVDSDGDHAYETRGEAADDEDDERDGE